MYRKIAILLVLIMVVCLFCGCRNDRLTPNDEKDFNGGKETSVQVYICGAVQNPGWYDLPQGVDVQTAVEKAVLCDNGILPDNSLEFVKDKDCIYVGFVDEDYKRYDSVNANGLLIVTRSEVEGVSAEVVGALADYIELNGTIRNRTDLANALGDMYQNNYYKFYVSEVDYLAES